MIFLYLGKQTQTLTFYITHVTTT